FGPRFLAGTIRDRLATPRMRSAFATVVCAGVAALLAATPAHAARQLGLAPSSRAAEVVPEDDAEAVDVAEAAWGRGGWTEVREVLEPLAADPGRLQDSRVREKALALL